MTPQQIADQIAHHEAALAELRDLQKAQRPALAEGQVWKREDAHYIIARHHLEKSEWVFCVIRLDDGNIWTTKDFPFSGRDNQFEYVGLARDVLRVVQPDAVEHVAPVQDEPTGAGLDYPALLKLATENACRIVALMYPAGDPRIKDRVESITIGIFTEYCISPLYREGVTP